MTKKHSVFIGQMNIVKKDLCSKLIYILMKILKTKIQELKQNSKTYLEK